MHLNIEIRKERKKLILKYNTLGDKNSYWHVHQRYLKEDYLYTASTEHNNILRNLYKEGTLDSGYKTLRKKQYLTRKRKNYLLKNYSEI